MQLILIAVSLAMDAFAVSICDGLCYSGLTAPKKLFIPAVFGVFQGLMPVIGYFIGSLFMEKISSYSFYVAFGLLLIIGGKMIFDAIKESRHKGDGEEAEPKRFKVGEVLIQGVATSIDALAVGITLHTLGIHIAVAASVIAGITFVIALGGVLIGVKAGKLFKNRLWIATLIGGLVLVGIGVKLLVEGLI